MCSAGHVISLEPFASFPHFIETEHVGDVFPFQDLWSPTCLTSFQTLDRNGAASKEIEEDI
jgi:hypothetical protein